MIHRQGDVLIIRRSAPASGVSRIEDKVVLAEGEVTGHKHLLSCDSGVRIIDVNESRTQRNHSHYLRAFFHVDDPAVVTHEEHGAIHLEPGDYEVRVQQEYSPAAYRMVAD